MDQDDALSSTPPEIRIKGHERRDQEHTLHFTQKQNPEHSSKFMFQSNTNPYALEHKLQHISLSPKIKKTKHKSGHRRFHPRILVAGEFPIEGVVLLWSHPPRRRDSGAAISGPRKEDLTGPPCRRRVNLPSTSSGQEDREAPATTQGRGRGVGHGRERSEGRDGREGATGKRRACKRIRTHDEKCEGIRTRNFFSFLYSRPSHRLGSVINCRLP